MGEYYGNGYPQGPKKQESTGFGIASFVLGIVSLLLFCACINWITGILAVIFGILQIVNGRQKGFAIAGIVTAGISMLFAIIFYISIFISSASAGMDYYDYYNYYYNNYDADYDYNYDDDYDYDDYYDAEPNEFLNVQK